MPEIIKVKANAEGRYPVRLFGTEYGRACLLTAVKSCRKIARRKRVHVHGLKRRGAVRLF